MSWEFHHIQILCTCQRGTNSNASTVRATCFLTHLHGDLSNGPGGVVAHRDKLRVQVKPEDGHELSWREDADTHTQMITAQTKDIRSPTHMRFVYNLADSH